MSNDDTSRAESTVEDLAAYLDVADPDPPPSPRPGRDLAHRHASPPPHDPAEFRDAAMEFRTFPEARPDGSVLLRTTSPRDALAFLAHAPAPLSVSRVVTESSTAVLDLISACYGAFLTEDATSRLHRETPRFSSAAPFPLWMVTLFLSVWPMLALAFLHTGSLAAQWICAAFLPYVLVSSGLKLAILAARPPPAPAEATSTGERPVVSILIPVYREARSMPILVDALRRLTYPQRLLDVIFLLEADDTETRNALASLDLPDFCSVLTVPDSIPRTKPKAMNYALPLLRGEIVGILDAEDIPEPEQVACAVAALAAAPPEVACAQASLSHYNHDDNFLSRSAAMEYALWFDLLLTRLAWLGLPIPLGGTSLYIRTKTLREVGGWDPNNVTEDADLGARLARHGYRSIVVASTTHEEAPLSARAWVRQRSRWIKGFMQTWAVHMRSPRRLLRDLGWRRFLALNTMLLDGFLSFFAQPFFVLAFLIFLLRAPSPENAPIPMMAVVTTAVFLFGQGLLLLLAFRAVNDRFGLRRAVQVPGLWLYWQLGGAAAIVAAVQLVICPQRWEKTEHGLSPAAEARRAKLACTGAPDGGENGHDRNIPHPRPATEDRHGQPRLSEGARRFRTHPYPAARRRV